MNYKQVKYFDKELSESLLTDIKNTPECYYVDRGYTIPLRSINKASGRYQSMVNLTIPKDLRKRLLEASPSITDHWLQEIIVNKYNVGDFIPPHYDSHMYRKFIVISLCENGDGLTVIENDKEYTFFDKVGYGIEFSGTMDLHEVKPVKNERYTILYLYL